MSTQHQYLLSLDNAGVDISNTVADALDSLDNPDRVAYRNGNGSVIAEAEADRLLIVAGPGTGKSHLFRARVAFWAQRHPERSIYVTTFVRKLVSDLQSDIDAMAKEDRERIRVSTLHTLARSLVERNGGTADLSLDENIQVLDARWFDIVWDDTIAFHPELADGMHGGDEYALQLYTLEYDMGPEWHALRSTYRRLCQFYNALGFADFITLARAAALENPALCEESLWIIDEYQDFNVAEHELIESLTHEADGVLIAGDDDQALYEELKSATPAILASLYRGDAYAQAMLPFCGRCTYYICHAASAFITKHRPEGGIKKVYLPLVVDSDAERVRCVAAPHPASAVDYVRTFLDDHDDAYSAYLESREAGDETDPFLLILSSTGNFTLTGATKEDAELASLVAEYSEPSEPRSGDYWRVVGYANAAWHANNNLAVRKLLAFENVPTDEVHELIHEAVTDALPLWEVVAKRRPEITDLADEVVRALIEHVDDPAAAAERLTALLQLGDPAAFEQELAGYPIGRGSAERHEREAIKTAGNVDPVMALSMIGAKGLSAHHVIVLGCDEVNMQFVKPLTFFVAITRARESLHLVTARRTLGAKHAHPFVSDLPPDACRYLTYTKKDRVTNLPDAEAWHAKLALWGRYQERR